MKKYVYILSVIITFIFVGCAEFDVARMITATTEAARPLTDEEEYFLGRAVAARILETYPLLENERLNEYVNLVGLTVALHSDKPITYGGYHFAILDTEEVNAFACPGGIIFITKGVIDTVKNEDELAAVLAHEVAHINHRDGIKAIQTSRLTNLATVLGTEAAKQAGSEEFGQLVSIFEGSIQDVFTRIVVNGYSQTQETEADTTALLYLSRSGYDPVAIQDFLERIIIMGKESGGGVMKTHPATSERVDKVAQSMPSTRPDTTLVQLREKRFQKIVR